MIFAVVGKSYEKILTRNNWNERFPEGSKMLSNSVIENIRSVSQRLDAVDISKRNEQTTRAANHFGIVIF